jgi:Xaa-Pro aminopeptidase
MKREKILKALADSDLDALVAVSPENTYYSCDVPILTQKIIRDRLAMVVWSRSEEPALILCTIEDAQARAESTVKDIRGYVEFQTSPVQLLVDVLTERKLARGRIGIEKRYLSVHYWEELTRLLPQATFVGCDRLFDKVRMMKTPEEIKRLSDAAQATDRAIRKAFESARLGQTERETAELMGDELRKGGAESVAFVILATGPNAAMAHPVPGETRMQPGQVLRTDFGGYFRWYYSDLARTAICGKATAEQRDAYQKLYQVQGDVIQAMRPGVRACDLYNLCKRRFEEVGLTFRMPHIGHSIGIDIHEYPMLNPQTTEELRPDMMFAVEPVHRATEGLYHIEDLVLVTERGPKIVSRSADWEPLLTVQ